MKNLTLPLIAWLIIGFVYMVFKILYITDLTLIFLFVSSVIVLLLFIINILKLLFLSLNAKKCIKSNMLSWHLSFTLPILLGVIFDY